MLHNSSITEADIARICVDMLDNLCMDYWVGDGDRTVMMSRMHSSSDARTQKNQRIATDGMEDMVALS